MRRSLLLLLLAGLVACGPEETRATSAPDPEPERADLFAAIDPRIGTGGECAETPALAHAKPVGLAGV